MTELDSWFTGGGIIMVILIGGGRYVLNKINESFNRIIELEKENAVNDAVQDERLKQHETRIIKLENKQ